MARLEILFPTLMETPMLLLKRIQVLLMLLSHSRLISSFVGTQNNLNTNEEEMMNFHVPSIYHGAENQ
jgi:hypothetical protein